MGGNVGTSDPYIQLIPYSPKPEYPMLQPWGDESPQYINGQQVSVELDGISINLSTARSLQRSGAAISTDLALHMKDPKFRYEEVGLGLYRAYTVIGHRDISPAPKKDPDPDHILIDQVDQSVWGWKTFYFDDILGDGQTKANKDPVQDKVDTAISDARTYLARQNCIDFLDKIVGVKNKNAKSPLGMLNKVDGKVYFLKTLPADGMIAHSVLSNHYNTPANHADDPNRKFSLGDTILVSHRFINNTRNEIQFDKLTPTERSSLTDRQARAIGMIHEVLHLYKGVGHTSGPETKDKVWNDYIYWHCLKNEKVTW